MAARRRLNYSDSMDDKKHFFKTDKFGLVLAAALLVAMTGCVGYVQGPPQGNVYVAPPVVAVQDDYVYYPNYQVYYSSSRHQYAYLEGRAWVSRPAPPGVSINVLMASPSVKMDFHDSPAVHHAAVVKQYPKNWSPPGSNQNQGRNDNQRGDQRDDRGGNNGR
jgi:hypothetical protein